MFIFDNNERKFIINLKYIMTENPYMIPTKILEKLHPLKLELTNNKPRSLSNPNIKDNLLFSSSPMNMT